MIKVLNIYFEGFFDKLVNQDYATFDKDFYKSELWPMRPNSTTRLNIVNYKSFSLLESNFDIKNYFLKNNEVLELGYLNTFDVCIVHQTASRKTEEFIAWISDDSVASLLRPVIYFGTEYTWEAGLKKGLINQKMIDFVYSKSNVLRHTARTDRQVYLDSSVVKKTNIIEFEIGLDENVVSYGKDFDDRQYLTFVLGPEGRLTKNNELAEWLVQDLKVYCEKKNDLTIKILRPPYSTSEFWEVMDATKFFIFTSNGETFSYVLNDAKAKGVIAFYPTHMYLTNISNRFAVDTYPELGVKYHSVQDLKDKLDFYLSLSPEALSKESFASRDEVLDRFSIAKVSGNWRSLLKNGEAGINTNKAILVGADFYSTKKSKDFLLGLSKTYGVKYVFLDPAATALAHDGDFCDIENDVVLVKCYRRKEGLKSFRNIVKLRDFTYFGKGVEIKEVSADEDYCFLDLAFRSYKIGTVFVLSAEKEFSSVLREIAVHRSMSLEELSVPKVEWMI